MPQIADVRGNAEGLFRPPERIPDQGIFLPVVKHPAVCGKIRMIFGDGEIGDRTSLAESVRVHLGHGDAFNQLRNKNRPTLPVVFRQGERSVFKLFKYAVF